MDIIQMLALAELEQHTARARAMGYLGPAQVAESEVPSASHDPDDFEGLDDVPF
jgi:hypothetical protein